MSASDAHRPSQYLPVPYQYLRMSEEAHFSHTTSPCIQALSRINPKVEWSVPTVRVAHRR
jgi:hypothetical protein